MLFRSTKKTITGSKLDIILDGKKLKN